MRQGVLIGAWLAVAGACVPKLADTTDQVTSARVLAVRGDPPEAAPGAAVQFTALYVDTTGTLSTAPLDWAWCTDPRPLAETGPVSPRCLDTSGAWIVPLGSGLMASGTLPSAGCSLFGPDPPVQAAAGGSGLPVAPDVTGGYYQPLSVIDPSGAGDATLFQERIDCGLAGATESQTDDFVQQYRSNANPVIETLAWNQASGVVALPPDDGMTATLVPAGATLQLTVTVPTCPAHGVCGDGICSADETAMSCAADCTTPHGCGGAEYYVAIDPATRAIVTRQESLRMSWYASRGSFGAEATVSTGASSGTNTWTAPAAGSIAVLWVVVRDDRGGTVWQSTRVRGQ